MKADYFSAVKAALAKVGANVSNSELRDAQCLSRDINLETGDKTLVFKVADSIQVVIYEDAYAFLGHCASGLKVEVTL